MEFYAWNPNTGPYPPKKIWQFFLVPKRLQYWWWFRNPAPLEYGKYPTMYKVLYIPGGCLGFLPWRARFDDSLWCKFSLLLRNAGNCETGVNWPPNFVLNILGSLETPICWVTHFWSCGFRMAKGPRSTSRIFMVSLYLEDGLLGLGYHPPMKISPFSWPFGRDTFFFRILTKLLNMVSNHVSVRHGMILQVGAGYRPQPLGGLSQLVSG